jgi:RNA polymerase sigma-70 factor (ECF subfamily)
LQQPDAQDVVQEVFAKLAPRLPTFQYDRQKRFRHYLRTVFNSVYSDWHERRCRQALPLAGSDALAGVAAPDDAAEKWEEEYREFRVNYALKRVQQRVKPTTWQAFQEHVVSRKPALQVAAELGMSVAAVYKAASRVLRLLRQELDGLPD